MSKISILHGRDNWSNTYELPDNVRFFYLRAGLSSDILQCLKQAKLRNFNAVLVDSQESLLMLMDLQSLVFIPSSMMLTFDRGPSSRPLLKEICAIPADFSDKQDLLDTCLRHFADNMVINCSLIRSRFILDSKESYL
ncbi:MAG: hypothetical protein ACLS4H_09355 [Streptococcus salivarius]